MISFSAIGPLPPKGRIVTQTDNAIVARTMVRASAIGARGASGTRIAYSDRSDGRGAMVYAAVNTAACLIIILAVDPCQ